MKKWIVSAALLTAACSLYSCKKKEDKVLTQEVTFSKEGELSLKKATSDSVVARLDIEIADDAYERQTGLMYREAMQPNEAMLFIFDDEIPRAFYMKNTRFPLDIIFVDGDRKIVSIQKNAEPRNESSLPSEGPSKYVLEVLAGLSDTWGLEKGDVLEWTSN